MAISLGILTQHFQTNPNSILPVKFFKDNNSERLYRKPQTFLFEAASEILRLKPRDVPPAPLCAGASILYTLILRGQILYIGRMMVQCMSIY